MVLSAKKAGAGDGRRETNCNGSKAILALAVKHDRGGEAVAGVLRGETVIVFAVRPRLMPYGLDRL